MIQLIADHLIQIETLTKEDIYELYSTGKLAWFEKKKANDEAKRIAQEKEQELQDIYQKQLEEMRKAQAQNKADENVESNDTNSSNDADKE